MGYVFNPFTGNFDAVDPTAVNGTITGGTQGSVLFVGANSTIAQDNANLFYDDANNRLGIKTNSPQSAIHVNKTDLTEQNAKIVQINHTATAASNTQITGAGFYASRELTSNFANTTVFADTFNGTTEISTGTPQTGTGWTRIYQSNTAVINRATGFAATNTPTGASGVLYTADGTYSSADYEVNVDHFAIGQSDSKGLIGIRVQDSSNGYFFEYTKYFLGSTVKMYKRVGGVNTQLGNAILGPQATDVVTLRMVGSTITILYGNIIRFQIDDSTFTAAGKAAMGAGNLITASGTCVNGAMFWESFDVKLLDHYINAPVFHAYSKNQNTTGAWADQAPVFLAEQQNTNSVGDVFTVVNAGLGATLKVFASANLDNPAYVIDASGNMGIREENPGSQVVLQGSAVISDGGITTAGTGNITDSNIVLDIYKSNPTLAMRLFNSFYGKSTQIVADSAGMVLWSRPSAGTDIARINVGNPAVEHVRFIQSAAATVFNENGVDMDFRIEGDTDANLFFVDASTERIGIGTNAPTAFLHLKASTATNATVRIPAGTAPTSPNEGDMWNDSTQKALITYVDSIKQNLTGRIYAANATATVVNTAVETTIIGGGTGTLTLPANFFTDSKTVSIKASGFYSAVGTDTLTVKAMLGSNVVFQTAAVTPVAATDKGWFLEGTTTCRSTGVSGTVFSQGNLNLSTSTNTAASIEMVNLTTTAINTTSTQAVNVTATWSAANTSNNFSCTNFFISVI